MISDIFNEVVSGEILLLAYIFYFWEACFDGTLEPVN